MTNGDYIKSRVLDRDIMLVMMDGIMCDFGIWDEAWCVFEDTFLMGKKVSKNEERRMWLVWLSLQYNEKIWKKVVDSYRE